MASLTLTEAQKLSEKELHMVELTLTEAHKLEDFIEKHSDKYITRCQKISEEFIKKHG